MKEHTEGMLRDLQAFQETELAEDTMRTSAPEYRGTETPFVRSPYNYSMESASLAAAMFDRGEKSPTVQSEVDNSDINVIVKRFGIDQPLRAKNWQPPLAEDFVGVTDFQSCMNVVRAAEESFMALPASLRSEFDNDPQKYAEFCVNPDNMDEMEKKDLLSEAGKAKLAKRRLDAAEEKRKAEEDEQRAFDARANAREEALRRSGKGS